MTISLVQRRWFVNFLHCGLIQDQHLNPLDFFCGMCSEESAYALLLCQGSSVPHCRTTISSQGLLHCIIAAGWASLVTCRKVAIFHLLASCLMPRNASASLPAHLRHQQDWWPSALVRLLGTPLAHIPSLSSWLMALTTICIRISRTIKRNRHQTDLPRNCTATNAPANPSVIRVLSATALSFVTFEYAVHVHFANSLSQEAFWYWYMPTCDTEILQDE